MVRRLPLILTAAIILLFAGCCGWVMVGMRQGFHAVDIGRNLQQAALNGDIAKAQKLLNAGADVNFEDMFTPLNAAVQKGDVAMTRLLLEHGADINRPGITGWTALMVAAESGDTGMVKFLLAHGADAKLKNQHGKSALELAQEAAYLGKDVSDTIRLLEKAQSKKP